MGKKIVFNFNPVVNLILHVLCCADPSFPRKPIYDERSGEWMMRAERKFFEDNFRMEQTGKVSTTAHFAVLYQIPGYFSSTDLGSLKEVLESMKGGRLATLKYRFPEKGAMLDRYMPEKYQETFYGKPLSLVEGEVIDRYGSILGEVYERFYREHWGSISAEMSERAVLLQDRYIENHDVIGYWEEKTGLGYPYPSFVVELADPISTQGTSLMAERDSFSHWAPPERVFGMISHEVGTHIFIQTRHLGDHHLGKLFAEAPENTIRMVEALSYLLNLDMWRETNKPLGYPPRFKEIFGREITALRSQWGEWERGSTSTIELIQKAYEKLYGKVAR